MHAMQYELTLPADYDMGIIRHRVATRGARTDAFRGLGIKAYAIREKGVHGSPVNQYAPFYLWADVAGMKEFLFGPGFAGIISDFGRPTVRHWTGLGFAPGPGFDVTPVAATRTTVRLGTERPLADAAHEAVEGLAAQASARGVHSAAALVDPTAWELVHFTLWSGEAPQDAAGEHYQLLHVSSPRLQDLPRGRAW
ncbi:DUF4865 family protein [Aggregicoccus sp. 17bor-14]|uniref:DUF4865 family protein n=1 Tax=Myxococcaceae TaxID=31 RepID=UPI00129D1490|nr:MULTISPECIES: DUF4865 family protein [Myxococcaceae]MBF5046080.1 DUF4865 family protein [Simulacricoccus sp. 17bor-14]MRI91809.1 DUF4865 family protein [Aggregicoccus sp. 17bor-14]